MSVWLKQSRTGACCVIGVVLREGDSKVGGRRLARVHAAAARAATENKQTSFSIKHMSNSNKFKLFYSTSQFNLSYEKA